MDLRCNEKVEAAMNMEGRSAVDETKHLIERMARFANEALGIEFS